MAIVGPYDPVWQSIQDEKLASLGASLSKCSPMYYPKVPNGDGIHPVLITMPVIRAVNFEGEPVDLRQYLNKIRRKRIFPLAKDPLASGMISLFGPGTVFSQDPLSFRSFRLIKPESRPEVSKTALHYFHY